MNKDKRTAKERSGERFGRWIVLKRGKTDKYRAVFWLCRCDCGGIKEVSTYNLTSGKSKSCGCLQKEVVKRPRYDRRGENAWNWKGGHLNSGYLLIRKPKHPNARKSGYIFEHIYVMSEHIKRPLYKGEQVHHINRNKLDNRIENLELWTSDHPCGSRVTDLTEFAIKHLKRYAPEKLNIEWGVGMVGELHGDIRKLVYLDDLYYLSNKELLGK